MHAEVDGERLTAAGVRLVLHPARRRRQRDHAQRHQPRHEAADRQPRPAQHRGSTTSTATPRPPSTRSCAARRRSSTSGALPPKTPCINNTKIEAGRRSCCGTTRPTATRPCSPTPTRSTSRRPLQPQQVGFGAGGPHFCLGANLARREIGVIFDEIRSRLPEPRRSPASPTTCRATFINGIKRMRCSWS